MELSVYNLEFPEYMKELNISGYRFTRVPDYSKAFAELQHTVEVVGGEFSSRLNTGTHQITAKVELPEQEEAAILPWRKESKFTKLQDVLLFLSLFTGRNVFALNPGEEKYPIRRDPRGHFWGGVFRLSAIRDVRWRNSETGEIRTDKEMENRAVFGYENLDYGLEKTINYTMETISSSEWQKEYGGGYFIFIFRQALGQADIEPAFLLSWTIWEHLFTLHNKHWLDDISILQTNGDKKVSFILNKYLLVNVDESSRKEIKRITRARNRLVHFGQIPESVDFDEMRMFIALTQQLLAIILKLKPSNAFNTMERLESFLKGQRGFSAIA